MIRDTIGIITFTYMLFQCERRGYVVQYFRDFVRFRIYINIRFKN